MKNLMMLIKNSQIMKVSLLVIFTSLLPLVNASAQRKALTYQESGALIEVGDSVTINRDSLYYETGERILSWVYDQVHVVRQVSSKRHPDGVLVNGIYSWLTIGSISPMNEKQQPIKELVVEEPVAEMPIVETPTPEEPVVETTPEEPVVETTPEPAPIEEEPAINSEEESKPYQIDRFTIGLRGGFASSMAKASVDEFSKLPLGGDVLLDLQYAHYWPINKEKMH